MISASSAVRFRYRSALPAAIGATVAAERIATPELGPTFSWRLVPSSAYSSNPAHAAYNPRTGGTPASDAYAIACGTNTAQTASAASVSRLTVSRHEGNQPAAGIARTSPTTER